MTCSEAAVSCIQLMGRPWLVMFLDLVHWSQQVYTEFAPHVSIPSVASAWVAKVNFGRYSFGHCIWYKVKNEAACLHWTITQVPSSSQYTTYFLLNSYTWSRTGAVWVPVVNKGIIVLCENLLQIYATWLNTVLCGANVLPHSLCNNNSQEN